MHFDFSDSVKIEIALAESEQQKQCRISGRISGRILGAWSQTTGETPNSHSWAQKTNSAHKASPLATAAKS